jgi:hypothetical protein
MVFTFYIPISREQMEMGPLKEHEKYYPHLFKNFDIDTSYKGLSMILLGNYDYYVLPGCWTRQELIDKIPNNVWKRLSYKKFFFSDDTSVRRSK